MELSAISLRAAWSMNATGSHSRPDRRPRVGHMRPIWRVIAAITPMRRPHAFNGGNGSETLEISLQYMTLLRVLMMHRAADA